MKANVGTIDRAVRIAIGVVLIALTLAGTIGPWGWIGLAAIATGLLRVCPAYLPFGLSTCSTKPDNGRS